MPASSVVSPRTPLATGESRGHAELLLQAVLQRDPELASRQLMAWVHRRGVASLDAWMLAELPCQAGDEGYYWLAALLESPLEARPGSPLRPAPPVAPLPHAVQQRPASAMPRPSAPAPSASEPPLAAFAQPLAVAELPDPAPETFPAAVAEERPGAVAEELPAAVAADATLPLEPAAEPAASTAERDERASLELDRALAELAGAFPGFVGSSLPEQAVSDPSPQPVLAQAVAGVASAAQLTATVVASRSNGDLPSPTGESIGATAFSSLPAPPEAAQPPVGARPIAQAPSLIDREPVLEAAEPLRSGPWTVASPASASPVSEPVPGESDAAAEDHTQSDAADPAAPRALGRWARRSLGRARSLLRDCYEEAIGGLQAGSLLAGDEAEPYGETAAAEMPSAASMPAAAALSPAAQSLPASGVHSPAVAVPLAVDVPPVARWDLAGEQVSGEQATDAMALPPAAVPRLSARLRPPGLFSGRRPSNRPAPSPAAIADLRAWLPDADDQPRRAS